MEPIAVGRVEQGGAARADSTFGGKFGTRVGRKQTLSVGQLNVLCFALRSAGGACPSVGEAHIGL